MQIILGILAAIIIIALILVKSESFSNRKKMTVIKIIIAVILLLWFYESMTDSNANNNREKVLNFNQGKSIVCDGKIITSKNFYYENGTESFVAEDKNISVRGVIYPINECEIKSE